MAFFKLTAKEVSIYLFLAWLIMTALNYFINQAFPRFALMKTGVFLILILSFIVLLLLYSYSEDKHVSREEIYMFLIILATMFLIVWAVHKYIPGLFSIINQGGTFSVFDKWAI